MGLTRFAVQLRKGCSGLIMVEETEEKGILCTLWVVGRTRYYSERLGREV